MNDTIKDIKIIFTLTKELKGEELGEFLDISAQFCTKILLVIMPGWVLNESARNLLERLNSYLIEQKICSEWPGTRLLTGSAEVRIFRLCENSLNMIKSHVNSLFQWQQPDAPEDLCLLREDDTPFFITIAHEEDSYLKLTEREIEKLKAVYPKLFDIAKKEE